MGAQMTTNLVSDAFRKAVETKCPRPDLIHHSDRGSQYCAQDYQGSLAVRHDRVYESEGALL